jgi:hypothetical protein
LGAILRVRTDINLELSPLIEASGWQYAHNLTYEPLSVEIKNEEGDNSRHGNTVNWLCRSKY